MGAETGGNRDRSTTSTGEESTRAEQRPANASDKEKHDLGSTAVRGNVQDPDPSN